MKNNMDTSSLYLVYVNPIGKDSYGLYEYEFFFSETPETVWGEDWNVACPSACANTLPDPSTYSHIEILKTDVRFFCVQENSCFSIADSIDKVVCLSSEYINDLPEYPTPYRIVFQFEDSYDTVVEKLKGREIYFKSYEEGNNNEEDDNMI
jgi:hypothetical protein